MYTDDREAFVTAMTKRWPLWEEQLSPTKITMLNRVFSDGIDFERRRHLTAKQLDNTCDLCGSKLVHVTLCTDCKNALFERKKL